MEKAMDGGRPGLREACVLGLRDRPRRLRYSDVLSLGSRVLISRRLRVRGVCWYAAVGSTTGMAWPAMLLIKVNP